MPYLSSSAFHASTSSATSAFRTLMMLVKQLAGKQVGAAVEEGLARGVSPPDQSVALGERGIEDVSLDVFSAGQELGGLEGKLVGIETEAEPRLVGPFPYARDGHGHEEKDAKSVTSRPPVDQNVQPAPSRPRVPNRS